MIQAIVYDAVGTLIHVRPSVAAVYAEVGRRFGSRRSEDEIRTRFHAAFAEQDRLDAQAGWRTSEERERQRWRAIVAAVLDDAADPSGCFEALFEAFGRPDAWTCDTDAPAVLTRLHQAGYRQAMASNFDRRLHAVIQPMPTTPFLEQVVVSSEVGWRKPAPEFFARLAETLQLPPAAILFVGDDRTNDYDAARRAGMRSAIVDPKNQHLDTGANRLARLTELLEVVNRDVDGDPT